MGTSATATVTGEHSTPRRRRRRRTNVNATVPPPAATEPPHTSTNHHQSATRAQWTVTGPRYRATSQHTTATELRCLTTQLPPQSVLATGHSGITRRKTRTRSRATAAATPHTTTGPRPRLSLQLRSPGTFIQPALHLQENLQQGERQGQEALLLLLLQAVEGTVSSPPTFLHPPVPV